MSEQLSEWYPEVERTPRALTRSRKQARQLDDTFQVASERRFGSKVSRRAVMSCATV